ncbi:MAG: CapA family protein [Candidatus Aminicenantia bacterium]
MRSLSVFLTFFLITSSSFFSENLKIIAVGDLMPEIKYSKQFTPEKEIIERWVSTMKEFTSKAHIKFANLEGSIIEKEDKPVKCNPENRGKTCFEFGILKENIEFVIQAGFNVLSLNNNHVLDFGWNAYIKGKEFLEQKGIKYSGLIKDIAFFNLVNKKIALIAFGFRNDSRFFSVLDLRKAEKIIKKIKSENDIVIVSFHCGAEGENAKRTKNQMELFLGSLRGNPVKFAHTAIDAGADLLIGHGPHLPRAIELYKGKLIAYSLGNFFTWGSFSLTGSKKFAPMLEVELDLETGSFVKGKIISFIQIPPGIPFLDKEKNALKEIKRLTELDFPDTPLVIDEEGNISVKN